MQSGIKFAEVSIAGEFASQPKRARRRWRLMRPRGRKAVDPISLFLAPSLILLLFALGVPLIVVIVASFQPNVLIQREAPGFFNYAYLLAQPYYFSVLVRTVRLAVLATVFALPLGYLAAMSLPRLQSRLGNLALMGLTFPILAGPLVVVLGWMALLPGSGPIFGPLVKWGLIARPRIIGTDTAVLISLVQFLLPFAILTLYTALKQIPRDLYEAAESLGADSLRKFRDITLPLSLPGVLSTTIILFSLGASSYISPHYLGGAADLTLTTLIGEFILATYNSPLAAAASILLLILMLACAAGVVALFRPFIRP